MPQDQNGQVSSSWYPTFFGTLFYPGTTDPSATVAVNRGGTTPVNFTVQSRNSVPAYDLYTSSFLDPLSRSSIYAADQNPNRVVVTPAIVTASKSAVLVKVQSVNGDTPVPQSATVLGGFATVRGEFIVPIPIDTTGYRTVGLYMGIQIGRAHV